MTRLFLFALGVLLVTVSGIRAEEPKPVLSVSDYLAQLQLKLDHTAQRVNQPTTAGSSVVGLRGSKAEPLSKQLYWKGKEKRGSVSIEELRMFRTAVEQARAGQRMEAASALKSIQEKFPESVLRPDVDETLRVLSAAGATGVPVVPAASLATPS